MQILLQCLKTKPLSIMACLNPVGLIAHGLALVQWSVLTEQTLGLIKNVRIVGQHKLQTLHVVIQEVQQLSHKIEWFSEQLFQQNNPGYQPKPLLHKLFGMDPSR